jgi:hypothetical protein
LDSRLALQVSIAFSISFEMQHPAPLIACALTARKYAACRADWSDKLILTQQFAA